MLEKQLLDADEVAQCLGVSKPYAYKIMRKLNNELEKNGCMVIAGKVSKNYLEQKFFAGSPTRKEEAHACV